MWQTVQRFQFEADARGVLDFILGAPAGQPRELALAVARFRFLGRLLLASTVSGLYAISLEGAVYLRQEPDDSAAPTAAPGPGLAGRPSPVPGHPQIPEALVFDGVVGRIVLTQERSGQCLASLEVPAGGRRWRYVDPTGEPTDLAHSDIAAAIWRDLIEEWNQQRRPARYRNAGRPPDPLYDRAYAQLQAGRPRPEVLKEWIALLPADRRRDMVDLRNSFAQAMRRRHMRAQQQARQPERRPGSGP